MRGDCSCLHRYADCNLQATFLQSVSWRRQPQVCRFTAKCIFKSIKGNICQRNKVFYFARCFHLPATFRWQQSLFYKDFVAPINRAGPGRCRAQCKTYARGPSEQWFYGVIVFGQHNLFYVLFQILHKAGNGSFTLGQWLKVKLCKTKLNILKKGIKNLFFFNNLGQPLKGIFSCLRLAEFCWKFPACNKICWKLLFLVKTCTVFQHHSL